MSLHLKFKNNFWIVFFPFHVLAIAGLFYVSDYWLYLLAFWFIFGVIGNGVAAHRYFSHGQFETWIPVKWILGVLTTLGGIGPVTGWRVQHKLHHLYTDKPNDPHSPLHNSPLKVFYTWYSADNKEYLKNKAIRRIAVNQQRDPFYKFFDQYHYYILFSWCILLLIINYHLLFIYCLAYAIDFFKLGAVNYWCHTRGYRIFNTSDNSKNNLWLGWLGMGFGWHNTHHAHPGRLILTERWWEIDVEGYIGWLLSKNKYGTQKTN